MSKVKVEGTTARWGRSFLSYISLAQNVSQGKYEMPFP